MANSNTLIVIPAQDEEATIGELLAELRRRYDFDIVVVDDFSQDNTAAIAKENGVLVLPHIRALGAWKAAQTGIRYAYNRGYDAVITLDADGQHLPEEIEALLDTAKTGVDVVIGACLSRGTFLRHVAWQLFRRASGIKVHDITSGFRWYNLAAIRALSTKEASMLEFQDLGVLLLLQSLKLEIAEVDVKMDKRSNGKSRIFSSWYRVSGYMLTTALVCLTKAVPIKDVRYLKRFY